MNLGNLKSLKASFAMAAFAAISLGCTPMADYQLGRKAYRAGEESTAENHFYRLASMGFPDAQVGYGDVLRNRGGLANERQAEKWYLSAANAKEVRAYTRLGKLYADWVKNGDKSYTDQAELYLHKAIDGGENSILGDLVELYFQQPEKMSIGDNELRDLIGRVHRYDRISSDYATVVYYRLSGQLPSQGKTIIDLCLPILRQVPQCYLEIANALRANPSLGDLNNWIGQIKTAYHKQRLSSSDLVTVAQWLGSSEQRMPRQALDIYELFDHRNPLIVPYRAKLLYDYPAIADTKSLIDAIEILHEIEPAQADLLTGRLYYDGDRFAADPEKAKQYFMQAREVIPSADYFLGQIYWNGYLGRFDPQQAVAYLLSAARRGYTNADRVLAEIFSSNNGVLPNPVYAISFSELALAQDQSEKIQTLYEQALATASEQQKRQAQQLKAAEIATRPYFGPEKNQLIGSRQ